ncbi:MAG: hypothetical protein IJA26_00295 [Clostridia bacterium]|nr:hypothetical protein [Clostridia bacterium]
MIINVHDDAETIKVLLALTTHLKGRKLLHPDLRFIVSVQCQQHIEAARIASNGRAEIIYVRDAISLIIAHTCRQHGLSQVLAELFNFGGNELYLEKVPSMAGKTFGESLNCFVNAVPVGLNDGRQVQLNPPMDTRIGDNHSLVLLELDDGSFKTASPSPIDETKISNSKKAAKNISDNLLILGSNNKLPRILAEYNQYVQPHTRVIITDNDLNPDYVQQYENLEISVNPSDVTRELLCELLT